MKQRLDNPYAKLRPSEKPEVEDLPKRAQRYELLKPGDHVRLLARTQWHDPKFKPNETYIVASAYGGSMSLREEQIAPVVTIYDKDGHRESSLSLFLVRVTA